MLGKMLLLYQKVKSATTTKPVQTQGFSLTFSQALRHCRCGLVYSPKEAASEFTLHFNSSWKVPSRAQEQSTSVLFGRQ